ncbi:Rap-GAP domain-containing protein [Mycena kentingensis (nom. inval.)]|nr:Rap-GAP domain-containing protein [Mycena kentingensis (nom. inval.)]
MAAEVQHQQFQFHHRSPLDTLVRKTSARRVPGSREQLPAAREDRRPPQGLPPISTDQPQPQQQHEHRQPYQTHYAAPSSPLLHSQFNRQSSSTWADGASSFNDNNSSYLDLSKDPYSTDLEYPSMPPAMRDSWQSSSTNGSGPRLEDWPAVPIVTVSAPVAGYALTTAGRTPIINPTASNFSRPAVELPEAYEHEQKQRVLARHGRSTAPNSPDARTDAYPAPSPLRVEHSPRPDSSASSVYSRESIATVRREPSPSRGRSPEPAKPEAITLPRRPPSLRNSSPVSLYSTYSFYQLDSASPSPTDKQFSRSQSALSQQPPQQPPARHVVFATSAPQPSSKDPSMRTAQEFLQLGITHHENDRLAESAVCFERAATLDGGCGVGMLMYGLALRHGWGCTKNEKHGFKWLRRAAEHAVTDLEAARQGGEIDENAVQTELILAIYEVGQCFFHAWGTPKDTKMAVSYYQVAARMGDADAQMDLGFCLANGKGIKKDRKEAAKWYRAAVKQGQSDIGLAWIYKEKFQYFEPVTIGCLPQIASTTKYMSPNDADSPRPRPRANTSVLSSFSGWRRQQPPAPSTPPNAPPPMKPEELLAALLPPTVPSVAYARAFAAALPTLSPIPKYDDINPVLASLCSADAVALKCAGYDILSAYCENPEWESSTSNRLSYFALLLGPPGSWGSEIWEPRYKALVALTKSGDSTLGLENSLLDLLKTWIADAFEAIATNLPLERSDRAERERSIAIIASFLEELVKNEAFNARILDEDRLGVLQFYASLVEKTLDWAALRRPSVSSPAPEMSPLSRPSLGHRRNHSSISVTSSISSSPLGPSKQPMEIALNLYLIHLRNQLKSLSGRHLETILPFLFRVLAHCVTPLPRLSVSPQPANTGSTSEKELNDLLYEFLTGTYRSNCMIHLRKNILPPDVNLDEPMVVRNAILTALGGLRTLHNYIRRALTARMARAMIENESASGYSHSGAPSHVDIAGSVMAAAWPPPGSAPTVWAVSQLGKPLSNSAQSWVSFYSRDDQYRELVDMLLDDIAGTVKDILHEAEEKDEPSLSREEAAVVGTTLYNLVEYVLPLQNPGGAAYILPLARPAEAQIRSSFLYTLTYVLSREHNIELSPPLSSILLHVANHLSDVDTAKLPGIMTSQNDLTPIEPDWIANWTAILKRSTLISAQRPLTRKAIMATLQTVHEDIRDLPFHRRKLAELVLETCESVSENLDFGNGDECGAMWSIVGQEVVFRTVEPPEAGDAEFLPRGFALLVAAASGRADHEEEDDFDAASIVTAGTHSPPPPHTGLITPATAALPILSRMQSDMHGTASTSKEREPKESLVSTFIQTFTQSRTNSFQPATPELLPEPSVGTASPSPEPLRDTSDVSAVCALILVFSQLVFTPHALENAHLLVAVQVFKYLLQLLEQAKSPRIRLTVLQFLMRLRADRDHRLYFMCSDADAHGLAAQLGGLIQRVAQPAELQTDFVDAVTESRSARPRIPQERIARGRGGRTSGSGASRSRSRLGGVPPPSPAKRSSPLWSIPEILPFVVVDADIPSESLLLYDPGSPENDAVLPISMFLLAINDILERESNWEVLSYVLVHLPNQLANKHMFCGPKSRKACSKLLTTLCAGILKNDLATIVDFPRGLKSRDAQGLAFHTLSVLVGYQPCFDLNQQHALVEVFLHGLDGQPATIKCCLHALTLAAFELTTSIKRYLSRILEKLSQIMTSADVAVHIQGLLSIIGSLRPLYANFTESDFKMVFGVALKYLQNQNANRDEPTTGSWALSEHVRILSYYIVYVWFLALKVPDRANHIKFITKELLLANEGSKNPDGPTQVCFDWLERYAYASADPRPTKSLLGDIVMAGEDAVSEKTWMMGDSFLTLRTLRKRGWVEILSRRPSGFTKILCRVENVPIVGPGDVDPDLVTVPAVMVMNREPPQVQGRSAAQWSCGTEDGRRVLLPSDTPDPNVPSPDPLTGYVWSGSAPSQRRKEVEIDPSFIALQLSDRQNPNFSRHRLLEQTDKLSRCLATLDRIPVIDTHKVGIMYVAPGQSTESEILQNTHGSPAYTRFLDGIGRLINLRGQLDVYAGGLDPDEDGEYAYAWWDDIGQILYHTATMMPNRAQDPNLTNKKRHIGNDFVRIVWNDSGKPYRFDTLTTQFQFVNIVVEPHSLGAIAAYSNNLHENEYFKVTVQRAPTMPDFAPVGAFKLISAKNLPLMVRQLSLLADWFASVFAETKHDSERVEIKTNWHSRLDHIRQFQSRLPPLEAEAELPEDDIMRHQTYRDFTTCF